MQLMVRKECISTNKYMYTYGDPNDGAPDRFLIDMAGMLQWYIGEYSRCNLHTYNIQYTLNSSSYHQYWNTNTKRTPWRRHWKTTIRKSWSKYSQLIAYMTSIWFVSLQYAIHKSIISILPPQWVLAIHSLVGYRWSWGRGNKAR